MSSDSTAATQPVTPPSHPIILPSSPTSTSLIFNAHDGNDINDALLERCAKLFSENYGIWGKNPSATKGPKPGLSPPSYVIPTRLTKIQAPGSR